MWLHEGGYIFSLFLSSFMIYHQVCNKSNTISVTCGGGPAYLSGSPEVNQVLSGVHVARSLVFCVMLCGSLFVLFHLAIVLSVLRFMASGYFVGIFNLFFMDKMVDIFNVHAIDLITLSKPSTQILTRATTKIICCKLDSFLPLKSLQVMDVEKIWLTVSHLQNGMLPQPPQCISKSLEIKKKYLCL